MKLVRVLLVLLALSELLGCDSEMPGTEGTSSFRNLGKRADSSLNEGNPTR